MKKLNLINYIKWLQERNRSEKTIALYCQLLEQFLTFKTAINTESIRNFLKENINIYQPNSLKTFYQALSSYGKFQKLAIE
jgi:5'-deoxynucleotidase YfbR-like HD superfamily hydrolase